MTVEPQDVVAAALLALATAIQSSVSLLSARSTRKSMSEQLSELRGIVIGPDGKNGLRKEISDIKTDIKDIKRVAHDRNDRVQGELAELSRDVSRLDERTKHLSE